MLRRPRQTLPDPIIIELGQTLAPLANFPWGPLAMTYLGVPIVINTATIVVDDKDYQSACQKLKDSGFRATVPDRRPAPEIFAALPNPEEALQLVNKEYERLDQSTTLFEYPVGHYLGLKVNLVPNSFAHLPMLYITGESKQDPSNQPPNYNVYDNIFHPLEAALVESFVKGAIDDEHHGGLDWGQSLTTWVAMMAAYLEVNNDILDACSDQQAVEWFSLKFGRKHEEEFGPWDRRVSKRIGSGKEMPVDMRGKPLPD
ncbi:uncharacterized protein N7459_001056 [Penicillium hispanicum]|uniref:uncharacterized protein n=1 Tax=Penicillium hispanicum TaxID=1080232 RepID=UPI002541328F|nr:uncharacterized protein N7459_001056 [Penicillium hispanicum]KAJ5594848.1 hypothetical protein N7459_001056 [Penicillium hispanicum]